MGGLGSPYPKRPQAIVASPTEADHIHRNLATQSPQTDEICFGYRRQTCR
jgi:hypothetical protein